jgi:hypothetical protein
MSKTHSTTHRDDRTGVYTKTTVITYDDGSSKTIVRDQNTANVLDEGRIISVTHTDKHGNSRTT